ncbi:MAG: LysM peptidoglycan-binding domain-containing protein [Planctomycetota bacterium]
MSSSYKIALAVAALVLLSSILFYANSGGETDPAQAEASPAPPANNLASNTPPAPAPDTGRTLRLGSDPLRVAERERESGRNTLANRRAPEVDTGSLTFSNTPEETPRVAAPAARRSILGTPEVAVRQTEPAPAGVPTATDRTARASGVPAIETGATGGPTTGALPRRVAPSPVTVPDARTTTPTPAPRVAPARPAGPVKTYSIRPDDNFWKIAEAEYGDDRHWRAIAQANPGVDPTRLRVGQEIRLPARADLPGIDPADPVVDDPGQGQGYRVKPGQTLSDISLDVYGTATEWRRIYNANRDQIGDNPDKVSPGQRLRIPPRVTTR